MSVEEVFAKLCISEDAAATTAVKSLVFKPKTAKTATPVPIVVVALQTTATPGPSIASETGLKDPRLARDELFVSFFKHDSAKTFTLAHLANAESEFRLLVDSQLEALGDDIVLQLNDTLFIKKSGLISYLAQFESSRKFVNFSQEVKKEEPKKKAAAPAKVNAAIDDAKLIGITVDKALDFSGWYQQILTKGEMMDYYDVSGCYILRPPSYAIWEAIFE